MKTFIRRIGELSIAFILHDRDVRIELVNTLVNIIKNIVNHIKLKNSDYLEIHLYSDKSSVESFMSLEEKRIGVIVSADFPIMYEAWTGIPRIHLSLREWVSLDRKDREALFAHELIHSILHSSLEYYLVEIDEDDEKTIIAAYIAALVLKDLEVHKLMSNSGLGEYLDNLDRYWRTVLSRKCPSSLEEFIDYLKALTVWVVKREVTSILNTPNCGYMVELIKELDSIKNSSRRPWLYIKEFQNKIRKVISELHLSR